MKTENTAKSYRFQTIVATEQVRKEFSELRDSLDTTDKLLMAVIFALAQENAEHIANQIAAHKAQIELERSVAKEAKIAAKRMEKEKEAKIAAKKAAKRVKAAVKGTDEPVAKKASKRKASADKVTTVEPNPTGEASVDGDEIPTLVVDGTLS